MSRFLKSLSRKAGTSPGTLVHIGSKRLEKARITVIDYDEKRHTKRAVKDVSDCFPYRDSKTTTWINVDGLHDTELIERLGAHFGIHSLVLEDIVNTGQRPKFEDFDDYIFIVLKMLYMREDGSTVKSEQVSIILGKNYVISFQEATGDIFDQVRGRIESGKGRIRKSGADYLAYALMDAVVDNYFIILENLGESIEGMEDGLVADPAPDILQRIHSMKREMIFLRKSVWPLREVVSGIERSESVLVSKKTRPFIRDLYDHTIQVIDTVETFRDMASGLLDLYLSSVSNRMNQVMKVLTIIATIFIPLSFFAGLYGMNFNTDYPLNMPELNWEYGYPAILLFMTGVALLMLFYFRKKRWL